MVQTFFWWWCNDNRWCKRIRAKIHIKTGVYVFHWSLMGLGNWKNWNLEDVCGRIPAWNQLQTLDDIGNNQLCGRPILKTCRGDAQYQNIHDDNKDDSDSDDELMWYYAGIGPGLLVGFLRFCASLQFIKSRRYFYFHLINKIAIAFALLQRKFQN